jgi:alkanesulfonate monooxygenase SsuD/methylene tetrahydromethanopterin reductase-like flavin-dependent oxidoreductase (luciferase family)
MGHVDFGIFPEAPQPYSISTMHSTARVSAIIVFAADHVIGMYENPGDPRYECWTTSTALLANTSRIKLGQLVLCNPFRHPPLLAKMAATLDSISGGRLILGLGTGWHEGEFKAYGYPFEGNATRVRRLDEAAEIIKRMWAEEDPALEENTLHRKGLNSPNRPKQPPLMIAGGGEQLTLRTVAHHADISNFSAWTGTPEEFKAKNDVLDMHCAKVGRDPKEIRRSWAAYCLIGEDEVEADAAQDVHEAAEPPPLAGTPEVTQQIKRYIESGVVLLSLHGRRPRETGEDIRGGSRASVCIATSSGSSRSA